MKHRYEPLKRGLPGKWECAPFLLQAVGGEWYGSFRDRVLDGIAWKICFTHQEYEYEWEIKSSFGIPLS
jgi:hypothetical protein